MELFGIGPMELIFILLLVLIIFGPKDIEKAGKTLGRVLNQLVKSDTWRTVTDASRRLKTLPNELMREAGIEELEKHAMAVADKTPTPEPESSTSDSHANRATVIQTPPTPPDQVIGIQPPERASDEPTDLTKPGGKPTP